MLADFPVVQTVHVNLSPMDAFVRRLLSHQRTLVSGDSGTSLHNFLVARDEVVFGHHHVGKSSIHHAPDLLESLQTGSDRSAEVVGKVLSVEQMVYAIYVVLVLENSGEFSNDLLVAVFLHDAASLALITPEVLTPGLYCWTFFAW